MSGRNFDAARGRNEDLRAERPSSDLANARPPSPAKREKGSYCRWSPLRQQRPRNRLPFRLERLPAERLARAAVPIGGVAGVAFFPVQIGMHPIAVAALVVLREVMRAVEIAVRVMPERFERPGKARGRGRVPDKLQESVDFAARLGWIDSPSRF